MRFQEFLRDRALASKLSSGFGWSLLGTSFNQGSTFVVNVVLAHLWTLQLFGEYAIIYTTLLAASSVAQMAMGYTATKYVAETRTSDPTRAGRVLALTGGFAAVSACLAAAVLFVAAPWIAERMLGNPGLAAGVRIAALALSFSVVSGFLSGALAGLQAFRRIAASGVVAGLFFLVACWFGAARWGLSGVLWGLVAAMAVQFLFLAVQLRRELATQGIQPSWTGAWAERSLIKHFSLPAALGGVISMTAFWIANAKLARQPGGYEAMALFTAANSWRLAVLFLPAVLNGVGMALLNAQKGQRDLLRYRQVFWMNLALTLSLVLAVVGVALAAGPFLLGIFGRAYAGGYAILAVLMGAAVMEAAVVAVYQLIQSQARIWRTFLLVLIPRDVTIVTLAYVLCPRLGAVGLATAYAVGWGFALGAIILLVSKRRFDLGAGPEPVAGILSGTPS